MLKPVNSKLKSHKIKNVDDCIKVLEEETYLENIGKIIEKDFFPDLAKLRAQTDYLDAIEKNDAQKLREIFKKFNSNNSQLDIDRRLASPATFETPAEKSTLENDELLIDFDKTDKLIECTEKGDVPSTKIGKLKLDQYLNSHTSEDNHSFKEIIKESEAKHKHKYSWLYGVEEESNIKTKAILEVPSIETQASGFKRPFNLDTWNYKNKNYIMYVPDGKDLTMEEKVELARCRQQITYTNTRFQSSPFDEHLNRETIQGLASTQARTLEGKIGIDGKEISSNSTPRINGYNFVKTPSPVPGVCESPIMTWGNIEGTPFRLDGGDTPLITTSGPSFKIPEPPKREKLAFALAEKAGQRHRDRKKKALLAAQRHLSSPSFSPNSGLDRLNSMSPAARNLATAQLRRIGTDKRLQASYSPLIKSPSASPICKSKSIISSSSPRTVQNSPSRRQNLTDNLLQLNLPKRPKASDFF